MTTKAVVDGLLGDCGKGKVIDWLAQDADMVVRYVGGGNAGREIENEKGNFKVHLMPSGVFHESVKNIVGPAVAFDPIQFFEEYDALVDQGITPNVFVSDRIKILFPFHRYINTVEEESLGKGKFGSTRRGVTQFQTDVVSKFAVTVEDLVGDKDELKNKLQRGVDMKNCILENYYEVDPINLDESLEPVLALTERLKPLLVDARKEIQKVMDDFGTVIYEGQLGSIRDITLGIYPYISSSPSFLAGYAPVSCGIGEPLDESICVLKSYVSYVGSGPFPSEMNENYANELRERVHEYGTTSGNPRRLGWFDCVMAKYGAELHGATDIVLTHLDSMSEYDEIPVCVEYSDYSDFNGSDSSVYKLKEFQTTKRMDNCRANYEMLPGWQSDISQCREWSQLPKQARDYVTFIENQIGYYIRYVAVGKERDAIIDRRNEGLTDDDVDKMISKVWNETSPAAQSEEYATQYY